MEMDTLSVDPSVCHSVMFMNTGASQQVTLHHYTFGLLLCTALLDQFTMNKYLDILLPNHYGTQTENPVRNEVKNVYVYY